MHSKALAIACVAAVAVVCAAPPAAHAQDKDERAGTGLLASAPLSARLVANGQTRSFDGRLNAELAFDEASVKGGELRAIHFNVALLGVDQFAITGREPKGPASGPLGIMIAPGSKSTLRYDERGRSARGELDVRLAIPQFEELFGYEQPRDQKEDDFFTSKTQAGKLSLALTFDQALGRAPGDSPDQRFARLSAKLSTDPISDATGGTLVPGYVLEFAVAKIPFELFERFRFEVAKNLCLQPVRIRGGWWDVFPTGLGLAFGMPGAKKEWGKADVTFTVRDWMTVTNSALKVATAAEEPTILGTVNVDDCIEVFFVANFDPESAHGGGATWSGGTASAKIISSDGNATFGVDLTHLAHELGHVLDMGHPGGGIAGMFDPSTGTLMCPSGWHNDNPKRNSIDNKNHVDNPLLTFSLKAIGPASDCNNSADCGPCP